MMNYCKRDTSDDVFTLNHYKKFQDEDDGEMFLTSKEIAKAKDPSDVSKAAYDHNEDPETLQFKRYTKRREHKYTDQEMEAIRASCAKSIVHDYGVYDWYHTSDEERKKNDELSEISLKLAKLKRTYRRVDQYIEAMRVVYQAWEILSKMNFIHTKKEFFSLVAKGKIISNRIIMPKLKSRASYNMDMIVGYISNLDMDISHLAPKKEIDLDDIFLSDEELESKEKEMKRLVSEEDVQYVYDHEENPEPMAIELVKPLS